MSFKKTLCAFFVLFFVYAECTPAAKRRRESGSASNNVIIDDAANDVLFKVDSNSRDTLVDDPVFTSLLPGLIEKQKILQKRSASLFASLLGGGGGGSSTNDLLSSLTAALSPNQQQSPASSTDLLLSALGMSSPAANQQTGSSNFYSQLGLDSLTGTSNDFSRMQGLNSNFDIPKLLGLTNNNNQLANTNYVNPQSSNGGLNMNALSALLGGNNFMPGANNLGFNTAGNSPLAATFGGMNGDTVTNQQPAAAASPQATSVGNTGVSNALNGLLTANTNFGLFNQNPADATATAAGVSPQATGGLNNQNAAGVSNALSGVLNANTNMGLFNAAQNIGPLPTINMNNLGRLFEQQQQQEAPLRNLMDLMQRNNERFDTTKAADAVTSTSTTSTTTTKTPN